MTAVPALVADFVGATSKSNSSGYIFYLFILIAVGFYFLILRPQQRKAKALREQQNTFDVGDEVLTAGGIVGTVIDIDGDRVTLETSVGASFVVLRQYVLRKLEHPATEVADDDDAVHDDVEEDSVDDQIADAPTAEESDDVGDAGASGTSGADSAGLDGRGGQSSSKSRSGRRARRGRNAGGRDDSGGDGPPSS
jgi:preprotein translocase subunit YajC